MTAPVTPTTPARGDRRRWRIVAAVFVCEMLSVGSTSYAYGLFIEPLQREFDLSRAEANTGLVLLILGMAIAAPLVGRLLDRLPLRRVLIGGACAMAAGLFAIAFTHSLPLAGIALVLVAMGATALGPLTAASAVTVWFERDRGKALGITAVGTSVGGALIVPLLAFNLGWLGWRMALVAQGVLIVAVVAALAWAVLDARPPAHTRAPAGAPASAAWLRSRNFWCIGLAVALVFAISQSLLASLIPYATDRGLSLAQGTALVSALSITSIFGKLVLGGLGDRCDKRLLLAFIVALLIAGLLALRAEPGFMVLVAVCALTGFVLGGELPVWAALAGDCFDRRQYGAVMGAMTLINGLFSMAAVRLVGEAYDAFGGYGEAFAGCAAAATIAALLIAGIRTRRASDANESVSAAADTRR